MNGDVCECDSDVFMYRFLFFVTNHFQHPGGDEVLKEVAGKEATKGFDDAGHSDVAM